MKFSIHSSIFSSLAPVSLSFLVSSFLVVVNVDFHHDHMVLQLGIHLVSSACHI